MTVTTSRPHLSVVTDPPPRRRRQFLFIGLIGGLLVFCLVALLLLNTFSAQDSFRLQKLQSKSSALADTEQALALSVARDQAPGVLASKAASLGMVPGGPPLFLKLPSGQVLGATPSPGVTPTPDVSLPPLTSTSAAPSTAAAPSASASATPSASTTPKPTVTGSPSGAAPRLSGH